MLAWAGRASLMPSSDLMSRSLAVSDGDFLALPALGLAGPSCSFTAAFWSHAGSTFACFPSYPVTSSVRRGGLVSLLAFGSPFGVIIISGPSDRDRARRAGGHPPSGCVGRFTLRDPGIREAYRLSD